MKYRLCTAAYTTFLSHTMATTHPLSAQVGLANLGNTCFLNTILQVLRLTPPIGTRCLTSDLKIRKGTTRGEFALAFQTLVRDFWSRAPSGEDKQLVMTPGNFVFHFHKLVRTTDADWYRPGQQSDAAETFQYILESIHDAIYAPVRMDISGYAHTHEERSHVKAIESWAAFHAKQYSSVISNFYGQTQICVECAACKTVSERYEPWFMLKLPLPEQTGSAPVTLQSCLDAAFASETIDGYDCDVCTSKQSATITTRISRLPPITILSFKRFTNHGTKIHTPVQWDLDATNFESVMAFKRDPFVRSRILAPVYETYAVVEHMGILHGGHYRMYARQCGAWNAYDDTSVYNVTPEMAKSNSYIVCMMPKQHSQTMNATLKDAIQSLRATAAVPAKVA